VSSTLKRDIRDDQEAPLRDGDQLCFAFRCTRYGLGEQLYDELLCRVLRGL
jgi:hypothetical protein